MSVTPRVSLIAWADRDPAWIFVAVPDERGRYLRTDRSVALTACPHCGSARGEPCRANGGTADGYSSTTHVRRRHAAERLPSVAGEAQRLDDVLRVEVPAPPVLEPSP